MAEAFIYDHVRTPRGRGREDGSLHEVTAATISYVDMVGAPAFVREADRLAQLYGERFGPPKMLRDMASNGTQFYAAVSKVEAAGEK